MRDNDLALVAGVLGLFAIDAMLMIVVPDWAAGAFFALALTIAALVVVIRRGY